MANWSERQRQHEQAVQAAHAQAWAAADELRQHLSRGGCLVPVPSQLRLPPGEQVYAELLLEVSQYTRLEVHHTEARARHFYADTPSARWRNLASEVLTATRNRALQRRAQALSAPQWRIYGMSRTVLTNRNLMIHYEGEWSEFPHGKVVEFQPQVRRYELVETFREGVPPLRLRGPWVPWAAIAIGWLLYGSTGIARVMGSTDHYIEAG